MKFSELEVDDEFAIESGKTFVKVKLKKATCCTPAYNAVESGLVTKKSRKKFEDDKEVTLMG